MSRTINLSSLLLVFLLCTSQAYALFGGSNSETVQGRINSIQNSNFTITTSQNQFLRILVTQDRAIPAELQLGVEVRVKIKQGRDGFWYLDKFREIKLTPGASLTP